MVNNMMEKKLKKKCKILEKRIAHDNDDDKIDDHKNDYQDKETEPALKRKNIEESDVLYIPDYIPLDEELSEYQIMQILDENGFEVTDEDVDLLTEAIENGEIILESVIATAIGAGALATGVGLGAAHIVHNYKREKYEGKYYKARYKKFKKREKDAKKRLKRKKRKLKKKEIEEEDIEKKDLDEAKAEPKKSGESSEEKKD